MVSNITSSIHIETVSITTPSGDLEVTQMLQKIEKKDWVVIDEVTNLFKKFPNHPKQREIAEKASSLESIRTRFLERFIIHLIQIGFYDLARNELEQVDLKAYNSSNYTHLLFEYHAPISLMKWFLDLGAPLRNNIWEELPRWETPSSVYIFLVDYGIQIFQKDLSNLINSFRTKVPEDAIIYILEKHPNLVSKETLSDATYKNYLKVVDFLLNNKCQCNESTLGIAAYSFSDKFIRRLVDYGAKPDGKAFAVIAARFGEALLDYVIKVSNVHPTSSAYKYIGLQDVQYTPRQAIDMLAIRGAGQMENCTLGKYIPGMSFAESMSYISERESLEGMNLTESINRLKMSDEECVKFLDECLKKGASIHWDNCLSLIGKKYKASFKCGMLGGRIILGDSHDIKNTINFIGVEIAEFIEAGLFSPCLLQEINRLFKDNPDAIEKNTQAAFTGTQKSINFFYRPLLDEEKFRTFLNKLFGNSKELDKKDYINWLESSLEAFYIHNIEWEGAIAYANLKYRYWNYSSSNDRSPYSSPYGFNYNVYSRIKQYIECNEIKQLNREVKKQAYKLTVLFGSYVKAINYLLEFMRKNDIRKAQGKRYTEKPIHDACLFNIPDETEGPWDIEGWRRYMKRNDSNPLQFNMLPYVAKIERFAWRGLSHLVDTEGKTSREILAEYRKLITNRMENDPEFGESIQTVRKEIQKRRTKANTRKLESLLWECSKKHFATEIKCFLHEQKHLRKTIEAEISIQELTQAQQFKIVQKKLWEEVEKQKPFRPFLNFFVRMRNPFNYTYSGMCSFVRVNSNFSDTPHYNTFVEQAIRYGIDTESIKKAIAILDEIAALELLPDIDVTAKELGIPERKWRFKKLSSRDPDIFILGKKTGCCQSIGGHANSTVIHGAESNYGGFYAIVKTTTKKVEYIAQSYVGICRAEDGHGFEIVVDSIETIYSNMGPDILKVYERAFGKVLEANRIFTRVVLGMGGKTPKNNYPSIEKNQGYPPIIGHPSGGYDAIFFRKVMAEPKEIVRFDESSCDEFIVTRGIDSYIKRGQQINELVLHPFRRISFYATHRKAYLALTSHKKNPLIKEGAIKEANNTPSWGEHFITDNVFQSAVEKWLEKSEIDLPYIHASNDVKSLYSQATQLAQDVQTFIASYVDDVHITSAYVTRNEDDSYYCFIFDSEGSSNGTVYHDALSKQFPNMKFIIFNERLSKDYYSCGTLAFIAITHFIKRGKMLIGQIVPQLKQINENTYSIDLNDLPGCLLKYAQIDIAFSDEQLTEKRKPVAVLPTSRRNEIVSWKRERTLADYLKDSLITIRGKRYNVAALRKKYRILHLYDSLESES